MNIAIDSNIQHIIMRLGGVDYPISTLKLSQNGGEAVTVWPIGSSNPINYVTELKMSNPRTVNASWTSMYANLNTGITLTQNLKWRAIFTIYKQDGGYVFGATGSGTRSYRAFTYSNQLFFDIGNSRIGTGWGIQGMSINSNGTTPYDVTFNNFYYTNNDTGTTYNPNGSATSTVNSDFYVCLDSIGLRALQIYDSTGTSLVFDGWPALDENNQPCLYDKISQTYKYFTVPSGSASGYVTYKSLTPYNVALSVNDATMGSTSGSGTYYVGDIVYLSASSNTGYRFVGWYDGSTLISSSSNYSFTIYNNVSYEARFEVIPQYTITLSVNDDTMGSVSGGGTYYDGTNVSIVATSNSGYRFVSWTENNTIVSTHSTYSFTLYGNTTLIANFEEASSAYTEVSCIKATSTSGTTSYYFDTGISSGPNSGTIEIDMEFMPLANNGSVFFGHTGGGYISQNDSNDFRIFWYNGQMYCDVGSARVNTATNVGFNQWKDWVWTVDYSNSVYNIKVNGSSSTFLSTSLYGSPNQYNIYINLSPMKFKSLTIKKNGTTIFDGVAALDNNNVPCIYDKTSGNFNYYLGSGSSSGITYEA